MNKVEKIAVFSHNKPFFGATIVQFPLYQHLRKNYPEAHIKVYSPVAEANIFIEYGLADQVELYTKSALRNYWQLPKSVNTYKPDIIVNCREFSEQINVVVGLSKAKLKVGFKPNSFTAAFYDRTIPYNPGLYRGSNFLYLAYLLDLKYKFGFDAIKNLAKPSNLELSQSKVNICIIPGGGEGEHKRWGIENFISLCKKYLAAEPRACFVFILGFKEEDYIDPIKSTLPEGSYRILFKVRIPDMVKAIVQSKAVVANDCGPSHLAQMCISNYISVWGWENQKPYERIAEWFVPHENAIYVVAEKDQSIKTVTADTVLPHLLKLTS